MYIFFIWINVVHPKNEKLFFKILPMDLLYVNYKIMLE